MIEMDLYKFQRKALEVDKEGREKGCKYGDWITDK
jgi:hypothetical protein